MSLLARRILKALSIDDKDWTIDLLKAEVDAQALIDDPEYKGHCRWSELHGCITELTEDGMVDVDYEGVITLTLAGYKWAPNS